MENVIKVLKNSWLIMLLQHCNKAISSYIIHLTFPFPTSLKKKFPFPLSFRKYIVTLLHKYRTYFFLGTQTKTQIKKNTTHHSHMGMRVYRMCLCSLTTFASRSSLAAR